MVPFRPVWVLAHGFADAGGLPVPLPLLVTGALLVVVAAAGVPPRSATPPPALAAGLPPSVRTGARWLSALLLAAIVVPAAFGPSDPALNPAPRLVFTVAWAGLLLVSALLGPWWRQVSPLQLMAADEWAPPDSVWPAAAALAVFGVVEQVLTATPLVTLAVLGCYVVGGTLIAARWGTRGLAAADPLDVASGALGSLAPIGRRRLRSPRQGAAAHSVVPGLAAFLGVLAGINLVDALEPPGGVAAFGAYLAVVAVSSGAFWAAARPAFLTPALIPAVAGHLGAHYLAPLLVETQIALVLASDPLHRDWNLLGLTGVEINAEPIPVALGLWLQLVLLVAGHALAMVVANDIARDRLPARAVGATLFGLRAVLGLSLVAGVFLRFGGPA